MPPKIARPRREMDYMGITFTEGIVGENQRGSYHKLFKRNVLATRYPDNDTLRDLGLIDCVNWMLSNLGGSCIIGTTYFRMFNRDYTFSQDHMANIFSFPHGDEYACKAPLESEWEASALDFWRQLTGKTTTDWEGLKATAIQNPVIRYLHRILANTIFGRKNTDLDYCRSMRLIKNTPNDKYYLIISNIEVRGVTLPCATRINVRLRANWIFDANAPDPDDTIRPDRMEQDAPHTGSHAHITHAFFYSFAGTSSEYQPHEEYDYTTMRTTLDDILSELRHQNNVSAVRDILLRSIQRQQEEMKVTIDQIKET
ncbi:hypothetical protein KIW84_073922 [Lathyrus oleraceus]|uniref:Arabidopsis retrotransposon Orf1 C-terminal domain-containing protein n=1 Tax=Pisum sativum TaxID=3888 RepID=A0A9D4ZW72_PEA|nr:hypothetical protein KIW84_073922 [Pisum sativum]